MGGPGHPMTGPDTVYNAFPVLPCRPAIPLTCTLTGIPTCAHLPVCSGIPAHLHKRSDPPPHPAAHRLFVPAFVPFSCRLCARVQPRVPVCPFPHCGSYSAHTKRTGRPAKFFKKSYPHSDLHLYPRAAPLCQPLCRPFLYCDSAWYTPIGLPFPVCTCAGQTAFLYSVCRIGPCRPPFALYRPYIVKCTKKPF